MTSMTSSRFSDSRDGAYIPPERLSVLESSDGALILSAYLDRGWVFGPGRKWGDCRQRALETIQRLAAQRLKAESGESG